MRILLTMLTLSALATTVAVARSVKVESSNAYYSYSQGSQSYENPDRVYGNRNEPPSP
jgi:hypothetical protein